MKRYKRTTGEKRPLWQYLGLSRFFLRRDVDKAFLLQKSKGRKAVLAWKVLRDPYFSKEYKKHRSVQRLKEAGFFDDGLEPGALRAVDYLCADTPVHKIERRLRSAGRKPKCVNAVLLMTGAFSPIHKGHVLCMEAAKEELERRGKNVIAGYFSPSHDIYVNTKDSGAAKMDAVKRLMLCRKAIKNSRWLMVDDWESLGVAVPVTFTMVYERLEKYLQHRLSSSAKLEIHFVVGSDNAAYARAFTNKGHCICVERFGYRATYEQILQECKNSKRIVFVEYRDRHLKCSSSSVRRGSLDMLDGKVVDCFKRLRSARGH